MTEERARFENIVTVWRDNKTKLADHLELAELAELEDDQHTQNAVIADMTAMRDLLEEKEIETLLSGEADTNDAFLEIHPGAGGTESQDWAQMLFRMYARWAEANNFKAELIEQTPGEEAGLKSGVILVKGGYAFGKLKTESGVHRLVRISPFDSNARRHTSFASVWVYPLVDNNIDIEIDPSDLRIDVYRASGAGGQHVNTTESAVRITHMPTGVVVQCQNDRSQHKNKAACMEMLKSRLYEVELRKREDAAQLTEDSKSEIGWGRQIRSYVLQPYRMVKDLRTGVTSHSPDDVLDGALNPFIAASLAQRIDGGAPVEIEDVD